MQRSALQSQRFSDYTNIPFEIFIAVFTILPFFVLAYFSLYCLSVCRFFAFKMSTNRFVEATFLATSTNTWPDDFIPGPTQNDPPITRNCTSVVSYDLVDRLLVQKNEG